MEKQIIAIASDHAAVELKATIKDMLTQAGYVAVDLGPFNADSVDYPDFAHKLCDAMAAGDATMGILMCGSGIGMSIAANRHKGIRAALCQNGYEATLARQHNNANVLCMGARLIGVDMAKDCVRHFVNTPFEGGRHLTRVAKLDQ